jgi:hypothetical protein
MAGGIVQLTILDGNRVQRSVQMWSSNGSLSGFLTPLSLPASYGATPKGYQQITDLTASIGLTVPAGSTYAIVQAETVDLRWRDDGVAPGAAVGMLLPSTQTMIFAGLSMAAVKFIQTTAGGILNASYYQ